MTYDIVNENSLPDVGKTIVRNARVETIGRSGVFIGIRFEHCEIILEANDAKGSCLFDACQFYCCAAIVNGMRVSMEEFSRMGK